MGWFKRLKDGIQTATEHKREVPDGLWYNCKQCKQTCTAKELRENMYVCPSCDFHTRIGSEEYFDVIFDGNKYDELFAELRSVDMLQFVDVKSYSDRLKEAYKKTELNDAISVAIGRVNKKPLCIACMDFKFIGGSMGSVMGEKIALSIDYCLKKKVPLMIISKSGGARMMESAYSLMQMAKTSAKLTQMAAAGIPYFSMMTDPTTGGVTASFAMLGDINMSEPGALIGFAGPRVIKETIKRDLPENFQTAEYVLETGFLDMIVHRKELKNTLDELLVIFNIQPSSRIILSSLRRGSK
ncbi:MAG: acetyl-CoA carboxylase carboxyltransferase subunit beta [Saprospiraceae bacterium]|jgi:acetyl-CoA carboxylase carboxyl transferase subunit beta|nr:acetyl-CoA carboxylase carboxyltransferase subunit beta [Saprospiraceae bacterium]